jgi:pyruvate dehydrogenase E2 component (dihydrolipoamide acetyltransferase)
MRREFRLPDIGEGLTEGQIVAWHVTPGDSIKEDAPLVDLQTDKAVVEVTSPYTGKIVSLHGEIDQTLPVGTVIAVFDATEDSGSAGVDAEPVGVPAAAPAAPAAQPVGLAAGDQAVKAVPATRKLARELGVELTEVAPSGPGGRILQADVEAFASTGAAPEQARKHAAPAPQGKPYAIPHAPGQTRIPLRGVRRVIAETMVRSVTTIPHATSFFRCNGETFLRLRKTLQEKQGTRISLTAMMMKAMVPGLRKYPYFNASVDDASGEIVLHSQINIGFAAHTEEGVVVPVIKDVPGKSLTEISAEIERLAAQAREGRIAVEHLRGGTITLSNVGSHGRADVIGGRPIVNHPQSAIIVMSKITPRAVVKNGAVVAQDCLDIGSSYDHRIIDGIYAALFMDQVIDIIEEPGLMLSA